MSYLYRISQIPDCVVHQGNTSLRAWLADLNVKANRDHTDDSFTQEDFNYARTQPWGSELNRFGDFNAFSNRINEYIEKSLTYDACKRADCETKGGYILEQYDGVLSCIEPPKPPPPKLTPPRRRQPQKGQPPKPEKPKETPVLDIGELKLPAKPWWSQERWAGQPKPLEEPQQLARITSDHFKVDDPLPGLIKQINDPDGKVAAFVGTILSTAQASSSGISGNMVDVVFAIDHSESMIPAASLVVQSVDQIIDSLTKAGAKKIRFGLVLFNGIGRIQVVPLTEMNPKNRSSLIHMLSSIHFSGGVEPVGLATAKAVGLLGAKDHSQQVIVLTDEDGLYDDKTYSSTLSDAKAKARLEGIPVNLFNLGGQRPPKISTQTQVAQVVDNILPGAGLLVDPVWKIKQTYAPGNVPNGSYVAPPQQ
ncbi:MAG: VWA domain-containing protein [Pseudomonadota bacterium]